MSRIDNNMITKQFNADVQVEEGKREIVAVISSNVVDRDGEVVLPKGLQKKQFAGNPVVLWSHDHKTPPIGKALWVKSDGDKIIAKARISDKTQLARDVFELLKEGTLNAFSIGFETLDQSPPTTKEITKEPMWASARNIIRKWSLLEFSVVACPCNPEALAMAVSKGYCHHDTADILSDRWRDASDQNSLDDLFAQCWAWEDDPTDNDESAKVKPSATIELDLPKPQFVRPWSQVEKQLRETFASQSTDGDILSRVKGQA